MVLGVSRLAATVTSRSQNRAKCLKFFPPICLTSEVTTFSESVRGLNFLEYRTQLHYWRSGFNIMTA